jgi:hypothetical protein
MENSWPFTGDVGIAFEFPASIGYRFIGRFEVPGRVITTANSKAKFLSPKERAYRDLVCLLAKTKLPTNCWREGWVTLFPGSPDHRHADPSNATKLLWDSLVRAGVFENDKYLAGAFFPFAVGKPTYLEVWVK